MNQSLAIVYEDAHCLVLVKPPGQFTQGSWASPGEITLETAVRRYLNPDDPDAVYLGIVHRLDRPTSGLLIWAKTSKAARRLSLQFERRRVVKEYWAIAECAGGTGPVDARNEAWTDWLLRADAAGVVRTAEPGTVGSRDAVTHARFEPAAAWTAPGLLWLRLWPQTGRTHQLRVQAGTRGWPILGDSLYGSTRPFPRPDGIALHARSLSLAHPVTGSSMTLVAPLPAIWAEGGMKAPEAAD